MNFIVDHLGAMQPAPSTLAWPGALHAPGDFGPATRAVVRMALMRVTGERPSDSEVEAVAAGRHAKHSFPVIAGHLLPEDYV